MSLGIVDTARPLTPPIGKRYLKAEVANCVGGVLSPLLANIALSVLDDHFAQQWHQAIGDGQPAGPAPLPRRGDLPSDPLRRRLCATNASGGCDVEDRADGCGVVLVMEVGPPGPLCRGRFQTTASCRG